MDESALSPEWGRARRVLLVRLDNLGDVLMSTPAFAAVRESLPQASLTLLAAPAAWALAPHLGPWLDEVIAFDAPWVKAGDAALPRARDALGGAERALLRRLGRAHFDAAIVFTVCTQSALPAALLCRMAGIPLRLAHARENPYGLLSHWVPDSDQIAPDMRHEVRRQLDLVATVGLRTADERLRFRLDPADAAPLARRLAAAGLAPGQDYVLLHPGASAPSRRYPVALLADAATRLARAGAPALVACAGPGEEALLQQLCQAMPQPPHRLDGELSLGELAQLIAGARLLVANNSGPVHLAAALGTPVVDLYALTNPQHTPWQVPARVLSQDVPCRNCLKSICPQGHQRCLTGVAPERVARAVLEMVR